MTNTSYIHDEIKSRLCAGNSWHNSVESFVFPSDKQESKDLNTNLQFCTKPPIVCTCTCMHERQTWSYINTGKNIASYENMAPTKIFAAKRAEVTGSWRKVDNEELKQVVLLVKY